MRLRTSLAAALGAFALVLTLPTAATSAPAAALGEFRYTYVGIDGQPRTARLDDPQSGECVTLPEVADPDASQPAHSPRNRTTSTATVFTEPGCDGDYFTLRPLTGRGSERLKLRSVVFS
ncbi:hypothetical protein [Streptomyces antimicrobicus]|uniref:Uncharacterized protein n=1 Tax=Streptomyces antimicrobicus TaxID=2883108 RepID=A0ABS8BEQ4_9ACTN|nr:hypothetical protein [Streptomyces antimicrobicus]MCB5183101.1 hypothetical protein [Streptomyces antimicrobicus]